MQRMDFVKWIVAGTAGVLAGSTLSDAISIKNDLAIFDHLIHVHITKISPQFALIEYNGIMVLWHNAVAYTFGSLLFEGASMGMSKNIALMIDTTRLVYGPVALASEPFIKDMFNLFVAEGITEAYTVPFSKKDNSLSILHILNYLIDLNILSTRTREPLLLQTKNRLEWLQNIHK
jgi:hypothetical protein